ncbi:ABC transporter permease [Candidatus Giovannonibacteria bacterium]|nr:ABC transporter permease [Candidatus Giovannonibacteria bacterium]
MNLIGIQAFIERETERMFRLGTQVLFSPWISALLYILIFGRIVGARIGEISGVPYIDFVVPGLLMMNISQAAFGHASSALYFNRFLGNITEIITAPLSYFEIMIGFLASSLVRVLVIGGGVYAIALFFTTASIEHFWLFLFYIFSISIVFALAGLIVGLWAEHFEHLAIPGTFIIIPLTFLGGLFNSIHMLPAKLQIFAKLNPFFYFIDGLRYSMIGVSESNRLIGVLLLLFLILLLGSIVWVLFKNGYKLRN